MSFPRERSTFDLVSEMIKIGGFTTSEMAEAASCGKRAVRNIRHRVGQNQCQNHGSALFQTGHAGDLLLWAAKDGHEVLTRILVDKGAEVNLHDEAGQTPLAWAAWSGHASVVNLLLDTNAAVDPKNKHGTTPLSFAARQGYEEVVRILLEKGLTQTQLMIVVEHHCHVQL